MHLVVIYGWRLDEMEAAKVVAEAMGTVVFEARQKLSGGGPATVANFADAQQAEALASKLAAGGVPAMVIDPQAVRQTSRPFTVRQFELGKQALTIEPFAGERQVIPYAEIDLLLVAICSVGQEATIEQVSERRFSLGKTLLAGGVPMTRKVTREQTRMAEVRDESLWLYAKGPLAAVFGRTTLNYDGLGAARQLTRDLNFARLKQELRRLAPQARYDDRLLKRAALVRLLGPTLNPETDFDLAFEILARSLRTDAGSPSAG